MIAKTASGDKEALETIRSSLRERGSLPTVWDAFAGFGGIPIAARKSWITRSRQMINPVQPMLTRAAGRHPCTFRRSAAGASGKAKTHCLFRRTGTCGGVQFYGEWLENQALKLLSDAYPQTKAEKFHLHGFGCGQSNVPIPPCNCRIPLGSSYVLSNLSRTPYWAEPVVENGELHFEIHEGECPKDKESNKSPATVPDSAARFAERLPQTNISRKWAQPMRLVHRCWPW